MKLVIRVPEEIVFTHEITVEASDDIDIDAVLNAAEDYSDIDEVITAFQNAGMKILKVVRDEDGGGSKIGFIGCEEID